MNSFHFFFSFLDNLLETVEEVLSEAGRDLLAVFVLQNGRCVASEALVNRCNECTNCFISFCVVISVIANDHPRLREIILKIHCLFKCKL